MSKQHVAALRMRRHRARLARGRVCIRCEVDEHRVAAALVAHGKLTEEEALRPGLVARELERLIADYCVRWIGPESDA
jgi:hypothetical protein